MQSDLQSQRGKTRTTLQIALFCAVIIVMTFVPYVGYISYGVLSITTLHLPVLLGAVLLGPAAGLLLASVWGVTNILNAFLINPIEGAIFLDPRISIVPRVLVGCVLLLLGLTLMKTKLPLWARAAVFAGIGTLSNTVFVLTAIGLFAGDSILPLGETLRMIIQIVVSINGAIELGLAVVLIPVLAVRLKPFART
ncbi:MAG: ECF transporter S component [Oscillospiraceae bacterium]|jgi:uncharacterized membrane protein|nr:ECF transporter S component [Oscillospiraceae bacterium]